MRPTKDGKQTRPANLTYFLVPPEVEAVTGKNPTKINVMLPSEDLNVVFPQFLKRYTYSALACKGDGLKAHETVIETGELKEIACDPEHCPHYQGKKCKALASLMFLIPSVPGMGVWQMDTTSYYAMVSINNSLELIRMTLGRISGVPLELRRIKKTVMSREKGESVKRDIWIVELNTTLTIGDLARLPANPFALDSGKVSVEAPRDDDTPDESLIADVEAEEPPVIDKRTGVVSGFIAATPAQVNSLKIIIGQRGEAGITTEPINFDKLSAEEAAALIKQLQGWKDRAAKAQTEGDISWAK